LCRSLAKAHQGPLDALVNWRFSMPITRRLAYTKVTPNHITFAGLFVGLLACWLVSRASWPAVAAGGLLLQIHSVLDSCDGELARLRYQFSRYGQWFDNLADDLVDNLFVVCAGFAAASANVAAASAAAGGGPWLTLALLGAGGRLATNLVAYVDVYRRTGTGDLYAFRLWFEREKRAAVDVYDPRSWLTWVRAVGRRDTYVFGWMLLCMAGLPAGVAIWAAVLGVVEAATVAVHLSVRLAEVLKIRRSR
jgi:phosphatidylglycerophosphate synthase